MTAMTERGGCIVGGLACQRDSYLRELSARVVACDEVSDQASGDSERLWQVEFNDSVLFPEGKIDILCLFTGFKIHGALY